MMLIKMVFGRVGEEERERELPSPLMVINESGVSGGTPDHL